MKPDMQNKFAASSVPISSDKVTSQKSPMANSAAVSKLPSPSQMSASNLHSNQNEPAMNHAKSTNLNRGRPKILNLNKPSPVVNTVNCYDGQFEDNETFADENAQSVLYIDDKYAYLIEQVRVLSENDDGILTNQKLKHLDEVISRVCVQPQQLRGVMESLASSAILDLSMAMKVSKMMSSVSFFFLEKHQQRLYHVFIAALHDKIDGLEISLDGADQYFINSSTVLTEMFKESKVRDTENTSTLAHLIIQVFVGLLECNTYISLKILNVQLLQYGRNLYTYVPDKLDNLSLSVRKLLISRQPSRSSCRVWLSLLADQCLSRFEALPTYLQDFYGRQLDESNCELEPRDSCFASELPITDDNCALKLPQTLSNHRVQEYYNVREKRHSDSSDKWSGVSNGDRGYCKSIATSEQHYDDLGDDDAFKHELSFDSLSMSEKKPRPILGAGSKKSSKTENDSQSESYSHMDNTSEIPKFCPSIPPPNFLPNKNISSNSDSRGNKTSASQDNCDFWNHPPPALPGANLNNKRFDKPSGLSKRLDLNTWRQQSNPNKDMYSESIEDNLSNKNDPSERISTFCIEESTDKNIPREKRSNINNLVSSEINRTFDDNKDAKIQNFEPRMNDNSYWESRKSTSSNEGEHAASKIANRLQLDKKRFDPRKDNGRFANDSSNDADDNKNVDNINDAEKRTRRDSRGSNRPTKRDVMEVSRKASYWTHDDRCETDYDG